MLEESFIFLPGVLEKTEQKLWQEGIHTWDHLLDANSVPGVSKERLIFWKNRIREIRRRVDSPDGLRVLSRLFGNRFSWRTYKEVMDEPRFIDIETTEYANEITVVGISDGDFYQAFVKGVNLDTRTLRRALQGATCLITFNGSSFDLPIIQRNFPGVLPEVPHLDVRHICAQAGLKGGLKAIERNLMISRASAIRDADGTDAIFLWHSYVLGNEESLKDLIDYNAADVLNLQPLLDSVVKSLWEHVRYGEPLVVRPLPARTIK